jgi:hypothetical protein
LRRPAAGPIVASARTADSPLHIAWADQIQTYDETLTKVLVPNGRGGRWRIAYIYVDCGGQTCSEGGRMLGPLASGDGVVLYAVDDVVPPANCDPSVRECVPVVSGGRVRRVRYSPGGGYATTIPGTQAAAALATAAGRLAEQVFTPQGDPAPMIQIRDVVSGALEATVPVPGTLDTMAMSHDELALIVRSTGGNDLIRYDAATGLLLGSTPLGPTVDKHTLAINGRRILYQTSHGMEIYRIDLGRSIAVGIGPHTNPGPTLDDNGIRWITYGRWTVAHGGPPSVIHGLALP